MKNNKIIIIFIFFIIVIYAFWNGRNLISGSELSISSPKSGESFQKSLISLRGTAKNISFIKIDAREIFVDKDGNFREDILLMPGYNVLKIEVIDRFGKTKTSVLKLYNLQKSDSVENASISNGINI